MKKVLLSLVLAVMSLAAFGQGSTTSSLRGTVIDDANEALIGANIMAVHVPSGTTYGTVSELDGSYRIPGMRVGGPYKITVSYTGYADDVKDDIYLRLGENQKQDFTLSESATVLAGVEIVATSIIPGQNTGTSTQITEEDINLLPTLNRNLNDFTRLTPQAKTTFGGGFSIAGMNNRYNAIYIDGAVNNDVFGLADNGTNGGQTGIAPISIDAIDQIQVVLSPYDVTLGGFAGGGINAVTKSGTNNLEGTAYYFIQNQKLAGKENGAFAERAGIADGDRERLAEFNNKLYGLSLSGPLIKDKLFFFVNAELQDDVTPSPYDFGIYRGNSTQADLENLRSTLNNTYGYDPGNFLGKENKLEGTRLFGKLDFNLNESHRLTLRHQYTKAEQTQQFNSSSTVINYANNGVYFPSTTNSTALELNSMFGTKASNNLIIGFTNVNDDRDPIGGDFPYLIIDDGDGTINIGSEQFSTANALEQKLFTLTNNFKLYKGAHTLTFGTHNEFSSFYNLFIRQNYGVYEFDSVNDFLSGAPASNYFRSFSGVDDKTGDGSAAAADFNALQIGLYAQDEWNVNDRFTLTYGVRIDVPMLLDDPSAVPNFDTTLQKISPYYDLQGAAAGQAPKAQLMWSPRLGFNYDLTGDARTILRGGLGIFTSRIPFVWPGGMYTNNGITVGGINARDIDPANEQVPFIADPFKQYSQEIGKPSGQIDLFAEDFKYPQVFRTSLAVDKAFGKGWEASVEGLFTKTLNNIYYQNINSDPTVDFNWTNSGGDDRPVFFRRPLDGSYGDIYLGSNTNKGYTYNVTASLKKDFAFGLGAFAAWTYGNAKAIFEGTSSQNSSQWRGAFSVDGRNDAAFGVSDFALGHRVIMGLNYKLKWNEAKNVVTTISLFYEGESGSPYSYVYGRGARDGRNVNNEFGNTGRERSLIWIPADQSEINFADAATAQAQWDALDKFISEDDYLSENRGSYAEQNRSRTPFESQIDLRILQDFSMDLGGKNHTLQLSFDIFNFTNLLNKDWGVVYNNPFAYQLLDFEGYAADGTTPLFSFDDDRLGKDRFDINDFSSRWRMRFGVRYIFK